MSKLRELIDKYCPNGVEYKPLGDKNVSIMQRGTSLTKKDSTEGIYPVISGGKTPAFYCDLSNRNGETITVAGSGAGAGYVQYWNEPIFVCDAFSIKGVGDVSTKYLYYCLVNMQEKIYATKKGGGVPHVHISSIDKFLIPIPPPLVQEEIVKILDRFADYAAELQAELQARKEQYEYYRNLLLTFNTTCGGADGKQKMMDNAHREVKWMTLGEVGTFTRGNGLQKKDFTESGIPCIHYGQIYTYYGTSANKTKSFCSQELAAKITKVKKGNLIIACTSENIEDVCKAVAWLGDEDIVTGGHACVYEHNLNPKYVSYYFQTEDFYTQKKKYARGAKVIDIKATDLAKIIIPIPSFAEQERIVSILDRFETLINDLSQGLPAEIAAVQEQYEYYRNKLLSFPKYKLNA